LTKKLSSPTNNVIKSLDDLIVSSYFDNPRKYKDIIKQLKIDATFLKNGKYKSALTELVKNKKLKRKEIGHQYVYFKNSNNDEQTNFLLDGHGINDEYFAQFDSGGIHTFFLLQVDLANHTKWFGDKKPEKNNAKKELAMLFTDELKNQYGFHRLFWAGDGGVFVRTSEATQNFDVVVKAADIIYELFEKWKRKFKSLKTKLLDIRVSAHNSPIFVDRDPGFWTSEELNNFIKYERNISEEGFVITKQIRDLLSASIQKRFTDHIRNIQNKDNVTIMQIFYDSKHRLQLSD